MYKYEIEYIDGTKGEIISACCEQREFDYSFYDMESSVTDEHIINRATVKSIKATDLHPGFRTGAAFS